MNDTDNNSDVIEAEKDAEPAEEKQSIGKILKAARLAQVMSVQDIARQLRLSERQVTAIENDDHNKFPNRTFLRGFIRNYAKLVREDTEEFSQLLHNIFPPVSTKAISYPVDGTPFTPDHKQSRGNIIIILVAVLVSLLLIYEVYRSGGNSPQADQEAENGVITETTSQSEVKTEQLTENSKNQLPSVMNSNDSSFSSLVKETETSQLKDSNLNEGRQVNTMSEIENKPVKKEEQALQFIFNEESWVEVKDSEGKRIFSQTSPGNTEKIVHGKSPFSLTIGNAANVKLVYNNEPIDLVPYTSKHGGVARFTLD